MSSSLENSCMILVLYVKYTFYIVQYTETSDNKEWDLFHHNKHNSK